jgi:hypothetical protein
VRLLTRLAAVSAAAAVAMLTAQAVSVAAPAAPASPAAVTAVAASSAGGCHVVLELVNGKWIAVTVCSTGSGGGGSPGTGPGGGNSDGTCTFTPMPPGSVVPYPAPKGDRWVWEVCTYKVGGTTVPGTAGFALVGKNATTANPGITPQDLLAQAERELQIPQLAAATAPPRGRDGLVGLPEWFWIPRSEWHPVSSTVSVGPVWATVTATPGQVSFSPGPGLPGASCHGPGTPYNRRLAASAQHTSCSYIYDQPSTGQPGNAYPAAVTVTWSVNWNGSGGAGGHIGTVPESFPFNVPVAQGEALVTSP